VFRSKQTPKTCSTARCFYSNESEAHVCGNKTPTSTQKSRPQCPLTEYLSPNLEASAAALGGTFPSMSRTTLAHPNELIHTTPTPTATVSKPKRTIVTPRGRGRRTAEERARISKEEEQRTAHQRQEYERKRFRVEKKSREVHKRNVVHRFNISYNPNKACHRCGIVGYSRFWCLECPCLTCKSRDHVTQECPYRQEQQQDKHSTQIPPQTQPRSKSRGFQIPRSVCAPGMPTESMQYKSNYKVGSAVPFTETVSNLLSRFRNEQGLHLDLGSASTV